MALIAASGDHGDEFEELVAGWGRSERVDFSSDRRSPSFEVVDSGGLGCASAQGGRETIETVLRWRMGDMDAWLLVGLGDVEVEGVGLAAAAQRDIGPFPVCRSAEDGEGAAGGDALGFVAGEG
ncbi:MAG: hypothetical protein ACE5MI_14285, partial [Acidimicrobiia bacterium]